MVTMICDSGCCGPPKATPTVARIPTLPLVDRGADSCCESQSDFMASSTKNCGDECCSSSHQHSNTKEGNSFVGATEKTPNEGDSCCSKPANIEPQCRERSNCREGRSLPCCDSSCIDRLALRKCTAESNRTPDRPSDCDGGKDGKACRKHVRGAYEQYQSKLEGLGCICHTLLTLGQDSCCTPPRRSSLESDQAKLGDSVTCCTSADFDGVSKADACISTAKPRPRSTKGCSTINATSCTSACCGTTKPSVANTLTKCADTCCDDKKSFPAVCATACCNEKKTVTQEREVRPGPTLNMDLEMGFSGLEHVILSISGMTCTGCETKLSRTLATLPAVTNLKTSLVLSRAEFDLDTSSTSVADAIKHLERTTEFKCERVTHQGSSLDLVCCDDPADIVKGDWPDGVIDVNVVDKKTVRVNFDAKTIGSRDLVEKGWPYCLQLAPPRADPTLDASAKHVRKVGYMTLLSIILTIPVLVLAWAPLPNKEDRKILFGSISLALATMIQFVVAGPFYLKALKALVFSRVIEMDLLIVLSTSAAYIFSVVAFGYLIAHKPLSSGEFFETSTLLVTLIMIGRYIAALARQKAVESISIRSLQTSTATIMDRDEVEKEIDARLLQYGDVFKVTPDSRIPTDGTVISGSSEIDESMMTGESRPIEKFKGSSVIAGSINGSGVLTVRLTRIPDDNTISTIAGMVDEAKLSKPKVQEIADKVAACFVPVVVSITIVVFCIWIAIGIIVQNRSGSEAVIQAITYAIAVLIVSCPCAIGLAVPMVIVVATGVAAERGVIFKSADAIEIAYKTTHVVFDKTGTLTQGKLTIAQEEYPDTSPSTKSLLLGLIGSNKHPVSLSVASHLKAKGIIAMPVSDPRNIVGRGVEGAFEGRTLRAGNSRWLGFSDDPLVQSIISQGYTAFCFTMDGSLAAVFGLEDSLRADTLSTITKLQQNQITVHVLSGDDDGAVRAVASQLQIPNSNVRSRCTPTDKQSYIKELLATFDPRGPKKKARGPVVMFCGDGTNDAVALAQATIGVHMNGGTDVAKSAADIVLMRPSLSGILIAITVSRKSTHRIAFNFGWSFVYNIFAILLATGAFVHFHIPPEFAGLGELVSVCPVIAAGVLLRSARI